jgi:hypothetical protein
MGVTAGIYITTISKQAISMAEKTNILRWLPRLSQKQWQESGLHPLTDRQRAIETMLEMDLYCASSMCAGRGRSVYAIIADILQGPPYTPPMDLTLTIFADREAKVKTNDRSNN